MNQLCAPVCVCSLQTPRSTPPCPSEAATAPLCLQVRSVSQAREAPMGAGMLPVFLLSLTHLHLNLPSRSTSCRIIPFFPWPEHVHALLCSVIDGPPGFLPMPWLWRSLPLYSGEQRILPKWPRSAPDYIQEWGGWVIWQLHLQVLGGTTTPFSIVAAPTLLPYRIG